METQTGYIKALQIMFKALLAGPLVLAAIAILLYSQKGLTSLVDKRTGNVFMYVAIIITISCVAMSYKLFSQKLEEAKQQSDLTEKLNGYRAAFITQLGLCEGPSLFAVICYFLTGNVALLVILAFALLNFGRIYPTKQKITQQLELDNQEENMVD